MAVVGHGVPTIGILLSLAGELIFVPLLWLWHRHVAGVSQRARGYLMKRVAVWAFYGVGALAIAYLALYAYAMFTGRDLQPGDPIHIFRKPDAPNYSWLDAVIPDPWHFA